MPRPFTRLRATLPVLLVLLAACGPGAQQPSAAPAASAVSPATAAPPPSAAPAPTAEPSAAPGPTVATASATPTGPTATLDLPTQAPTITAIPAVAPFPLKAGWWDDAVCYEIFVRSFYDSNGDGIGDLNGLIQKLDYINDGKPATQSDLGATCLWLMPIMPSNTYHGYAVTDYYDVNPQFGTKDDFKRLIDEAHKRGVHVLIDMVLNHTSSQHPWFKEALTGPDAPHRDWYLWSHDEPPTQGWHKSPVRDEYYYSAFDGGLPDLNYRNTEVNAEAQKISAFWLNDMGADGFRMDAAKHMIENGPVTADTLETNAWLREYRTFLEKTAPGAFTIGENFGASSIGLASYYPDQLDMYFEFNIGQKLIQAVNLGDASQYSGAVRVAYEDLPFQRWAPFLTNHDQNRAMSVFGDKPDRARLAAIAYLTLPGLPFVYYGEEIGMLGTKPDEQIRTPMQWSAEPAAGFSSAAPWEAPQPNFEATNVAAQDADPASLLNLYRRLIHLQTTDPAFGHGSYTPLKSGNNRVAAFLRQQDDSAALVLLNFGRQPVEGIALSVDTSALAPGTYQPATLLDDSTTAAPLTVGAGGTIAGYAPLPTLAARTGYVFRLAR